MRKSQNTGIVTGDVVDQIFDMVKPKDPTKITLKDLRESKVCLSNMSIWLWQVSKHVFSMLTDINGFWVFNEEDCIPAEGENDGSY